jgi:hypothetical protein
MYDYDCHYIHRYINSKYMYYYWFNNYYPLADEMTITPRHLGSIIIYFKCYSIKMGEIDQCSILSENLITPLLTY